MNNNKREAVVDNNTMYAFPRIARGHGSRSRRCVAVGCTSTQHNASRISLMKNWVSEQGLEIPRKVTAAVLN